MHLVNDLINPFLRVFYYRCFERFEVNSVVELHFGLFCFFCLIHDDYCCVASVRFKAEFVSTLLEP